MRFPLGMKTRAIIFKDLIGEIPDWDTFYDGMLGCFDDGDGLAQVCWCGGRFATEPRKRRTCILTLVADSNTHFACGCEEVKPQ